MSQKFAKFFKRSSLLAAARRDMVATCIGVRLSVRRKLAIVARLLRGGPLELVAR
jgi:hypothetical protein